MQRIFAGLRYVLLIQIVPVEMNVYRMALTRAVVIKYLTQLIPRLLLGLRQQRILQFPNRLLLPLRARQVVPKTDVTALINVEQFQSPLPAVPILTVIVISINVITILTVFRLLLQHQPQPVLPLLLQPKSRLSITRPLIWFLIWQLI